jgi:hypothetical protein
MASAADIARNRHVIGFVGQQELRGRIVPHQTTDDLGVAGVAGYDPVRAEEEDVAGPRDRYGAGWRLERASLQAVSLVS